MSQIRGLNVKMQIYQFPRTIFELRERNKPTYIYLHRGCRQRAGTIYINFFLNFLVDINFRSKNKIQVNITFLLVIKRKAEFKMALLKDERDIGHLAHSSFHLNVISSLF